MKKSQNNLVTKNVPEKWKITKCYHHKNTALPSLDVSSSLCTTDAPFAVAGEDAGLAMPPTGPTLDAPDPTLLWCESACESVTVVHLLAGESLPPIGEDVDACCCWCVSKALSCGQKQNRCVRHCTIRITLLKLGFSGPKLYR